MLLPVMTPGKVPLRCSRDVRLGYYSRLVPAHLGRCLAVRRVDSPTQLYLNNEIHKPWPNRERCTNPNAGRGFTVEFVRLGLA